MIAVIISTCGETRWSDLAWARAYPSAFPQHCEIVVQHYPDLSVTQARNEAARKTKRKWLCFLDADDELDPGFIEGMERELRINKRRHDLYAPIVSFIETTREGMSLAREPDFPNVHSTMPPMNHCVTATVVHKDMFWNVGGWREGYWPWPDYELWLRCIRAGAEVRYVRRAVYLYHLHGAGANAQLRPRDGRALADRIHREHKEGLAQAAQRAGVVPSS